MQSISTQGGAVSRLLSLRGGEGQTINTQGGVGVCFISKCY